VSIAAETIGACSNMFLENLVERSTCLGSTSEYVGINNTSSNVIPSISTLSSIKDIAGYFYKFDWQRYKKMGKGFIEHFYFLEEVKN
jgi:hypothetical protein